MKKILVLMMVCLLVGCNIESKFNGDSQVYASDERIDLSEVVPSETTYDELLEMFGPADRYYYGERVLDVNDLPKAFYMRYDESLTFRIRNNSIIEMRIESDSITFGDLYCGQSLDEALTYLNEPEEVLDGYHLYEKENVLYKNIKNQFDGEVGYYHDDANNLRLWSHNNIVTAIYYEGNKELYYSHNAYDPIGGGYTSSGFPMLKIGLDYNDEEQPDVSSIYILHYGSQRSDFDEIIEYENDPFLRGKWLYKDFVYSIDEFDPKSQRSNFQFIDLKINRYGSISNSIYAWTKGWIINTNDIFSDIFRTSYLMVDDKEYLVLERFRKKGWAGYYIFEKDAAN